MSLAQQDYDPYCAAERMNEYRPVLLARIRALDKKLKASRPDALDAHRHLLRYEIHSLLRSSAYRQQLHDVIIPETAERVLKPEDDDEDTLAMWGFTAADISLIDQQRVLVAHWQARHPQLPNLHMSLGYYREGERHYTSCTARLKGIGVRKIGHRRRYHDFPGDLTDTQQRILLADECTSMVERCGHMAADGPPRSVVAEAVHIFQDLRREWMRLSSRLSSLDRQIDKCLIQHLLSQEGSTEAVRTTIRQIHDARGSAAYPVDLHMLHPRIDENVHLRLRRSPWRDNPDNLSWHLSTDKSGLGAGFQFLVDPRMPSPKYLCAKHATMSPQQMLDRIMRFRPSPHAQGLR